MKDYLEFAKSLALDAGEAMLEHFQVGVLADFKGDLTPVTIADTKINDMVISRVKEAYPEHGVLGEEASHNLDNSEYKWVCDPVDGTMPYSYGIPTNVFSLALVQDGKPIVAVVYDPYMKRLFTAIAGEGAYCNDEKISVSDNDKLQDIVIGVSGPGNNEAVDAHGFRNESQRRVYRQYQVQCIVYEAMMVALGQFGAAVFSGKTAHDIAAVKLIIEEAGGKVTDLNNQEQRYDNSINGAIVSNGKVHVELAELVEGYLA